MAHYLGGLYEAIQDHLIMQPIWNLSTVVNFTLQAEIRLSRASNRYSRPSRTPFNPAHDKQLGQSSSSPSSFPSIAKPVSDPCISNIKSAGKAVVQVGKSNPYAKPSIGKCFRCNELVTSQMSVRSDVKSISLKNGTMSV